MTISLTTQWEHASLNPHKGRTHLVVTVSVEGEEADKTIASEPYLDIRLPESARIRYIGNFPSDGLRNTIGVDLPDITAGSSVQLVFRVKARDLNAEEIVPDIHLHWLDTESDNLIEIDELGTALPVRDEDAPATNPDITEIVAGAKSERRTRRTKRAHTSKETPHMRHHRHSRHHDRHAHRFGRAFGARARGDWQHHDEEMAFTEMNDQRRHRRGYRDATPSPDDFARQGHTFGTRARGACRHHNDETDFPDRDKPRHEPHGRRGHRHAIFRDDMPIEETEVRSWHHTVVREAHPSIFERPADRGDHYRRGRDFGRHMGKMANKLRRHRHTET